jgi:hypothetical protein
MKIVSVLFFTITLFTTSTFAAKKELAFDSNVPAALKAQMLEDLKFMGSINSQFATQLHQKIFGNVSGEAYLKFFNQRVFSVGVDDCGSPNAVACVMPMYGNKIWMTKNYTQFSHPQIARLSVVYHEARHTERDNGNWSHATCPTPFRNAQGQDIKSIWTGATLAGEPACDVTPFGSYGSQTILLRNIAMNCTSCSEKIKADSNLYALDQLQRIVDKNALAAMKKDFGITTIRR